MSSIQIKRIYDKPLKADGYRILVDRLWPRGLKKEEVHFNEWIKTLSPSSELRKWFGHKPKNFPEFEKRYKKELGEVSHELERITAIAKNKTITLLNSAKNTEINQDIMLKKVLDNLK